MRRNRTAVGAVAALVLGGSIALVGATPANAWDTYSAWEYELWCSGGQLATTRSWGYGWIRHQISDQAGTGGYYENEWDNGSVYVARNHTTGGAHAFWATIVGIGPVNTTAYQCRWW